MKHPFVHIYLLILILNTSVVSAQQLVNNSSLQIKNISYIFDAQDKNKKTVWVAANNSAMQLFERNENNTFSSTGVIIIPKQIGKVSWKSFEFINDTLYLTGYDKQRQLITIYWHKNSKTVFSKILHTLDFYEHILKTVVTKNGIFYFGIVQNKNELNVYRISQKNISSQHYIIPFNNFYSKLTKQNELVNDNEDLYYKIDYIDYQIEQNVKSSRAPKKLYYHDSTFVFIFDENNSSDLIEINTNTQVVSHKKLEVNKSIVPVDIKHINSFYCYPYLYQLTTNPHRFDVLVWNLKNDSVIKQHSIQSKDTIHYKNGNIVEEGVVSNQSIGNNTTIFLRRLNDGYPAISVTQKDSLYIVEIGTFEQMSVPSASPNMSVGMGMGMGMGMGYGMGPGYMGTPQSIEYPIGQYDGFPGFYPYQNNVLGIRATYFHALFNPYTLETIEGIPPISFRERLSRFENTYFKDDLPEWVHIANLGHELIVTYYDRKKNTLMSYSYWL
jgi:hypothetical protein